MYRSDDQGRYNSTNFRKTSDRVPSRIYCLRSSHGSLHFFQVSIIKTGLPYRTNGRRNPAPDGTFLPGRSFRKSLVACSVNQLCSRGRSEPLEREKRPLFLAPSDLESARPETLRLREAGSLLSLPRIGPSPESTTSRSAINCVERASERLEVVGERSSSSILS